MRTCKEHFKNKDITVLLKNKKEKLKSDESNLKWLNICILNTLMASREFFILTQPLFGSRLLCLLISEPSGGGAYL